MNRKQFLKTSFAGGLVAATFPAYAAEKTVASATLKTTEKKAKPLAHVNYAQKVFKVGAPVIVRISVPARYREIKGMRLACVNLGRYSADGLNRMYVDLPKWRISAAERQRQGSQGYTALELPFERDGDCIMVKTTFAQESRYSFLLFAPADIKKPLFNHSVYALDADLFSLRPCRGDIHNHSTYSDGKQSPEEMLAQAVTCGLDYYALSDHGRYNASVYIAGRFRDVPLSVRIFHAEEVHVSAIHTHNFGGSQSITDWVNAHPDEFRQMTAAIRKKLPENLRDDDAYDVAETEAAFALVRRFGGIAIFNHPYWLRRGESRHASPAVVDTVLARGNFDAIEIVNALTGSLANDLASAHYNELVASGSKLCFIGNSDSHNTEKLAGGRTIAFARSCDFTDLKEAILAKRCVAVDALPGETPRFYGSRRHITYAQFLESEYYPMRETLCADEAAALRDIMKAFSSGGKLIGDFPMLEEKSAAVARHADAFFGCASPGR